jgi:glutamine synthetase
MPGSPTFAQRCGVHDDARAVACQTLLDRVHRLGLKQVRVAWCDVHGSLRSKTLLPSALPVALLEGITMASTVLLKDTSERTVLKVFEGGAAHLTGFGHANNVRLLPDPQRLHPLPWSCEEAWLLADCYHDDAKPVVVDPRRSLQTAVTALAQAGFALRCGLEVEFHVYRLQDASLTPADSGWPGEAPVVQLLHPGYRLISDEHTDACAAVFAAVRETALGLGLPLQSIEIEMGPSQFEAVFGVQDALAAADAMVLLRNGLRQALRRQGLYVTFCCLPPLPHVMASGWHLHHSLVALNDASPAFMRPSRNPSPNGSSVLGSSVIDPSNEASDTLSDIGCHWLAGLLDHARGMTLACVPTAHGYTRFRPNALAPQAIGWGRDDRSAMVRVLGAPGDTATRLENRLAEPTANPYLMMAAHIHAGLDGLQRQHTPPPAARAPYSEAVRQAAPLPTSLGEAAQSLLDDPVIAQGLGADMALLYATMKRFEAQRLAQAPDPDAWMRREYFARL